MDVGEQSAARLQGDLVGPRSNDGLLRSEALPVLDWSYGEKPTYDLPGRCLTCGQEFIVRREKGVKPPLSVDCPSCQCSEYSWRRYPSALAATPAEPEPIDVERLMDAEHRFCVQIEGEWALGHDVERHRRQAEFILARLTGPAQRETPHDRDHDPELCAECRVYYGMSEDQD